MSRRSLSLKLFLALALLLLVTVTVFAVTFAYALNLRSEHELGESSIGKLKVADAMVNHLKDSINKETLRLMINEAVKGIEAVNSRGATAMDTEDLLRLGKVIDALREIVLTDDSYHSIYLYPDDLDFVLTSTRGFLAKQNLNDTGWLKHYEEFRSLGTPLSWIDSRLPDDGKGFIGVGTLEYVMTCVSPLGPYATPFRGALVVNFREASLSQRINSGNFDGQGYLAVINNDGEVVSHPDKMLLGRSIRSQGYVKTVLASPASKGYFISPVDGERSLVSYYRSRDTQWVYVGIFSLHALDGKASSLLVFVACLSLVFLSVGIAVAFQVSRRLSSPLRQLCQDIKKTRGVDFADEDDEMSVIRQAFETLKRREETLADDLETNRRSLYESYLSALLHGEPFQFADAGILKVDFFLPTYVCALISIDNYPGFVRDYGASQGQVAQKLILEISEQVLGAEFICAGLTTEREAIPLIINTEDGDAERLQRRLRAAFQRVQKEVTRVFECTITVGIGMPRPSREGIKESFAEARQAAQLRLLFGYGSINVWTGEGRETYYPFAAEKSIQKGLAQLDIAAIREALRLLVLDVRARPGRSSQAVLQMFNQLIGNTVVKSVVEARSDLAEVYGPAFNVYSELSKKETLEQVQGWLIELYSLLIEHRERTRVRNNDKADRIVEYIDANFRSDLTIKGIADHVKLSYSHARKIFRDHTGGNILDYINALRINEARLLLADDSLNIKGIAYALGYNSGQRFTRAFKKVQGMTPAEYRARAASALRDAGSEGVGVSRDA